MPRWSPHVTPWVAAKVYKGGVLNSNFLVCDRVGRQNSKIAFNSNLGPRYKNYGVFKFKYWDFERHSANIIPCHVTPTNQQYLDVKRLTKSRVLIDCFHTWNLFVYIWPSTRIGRAGASHQRVINTQCLTLSRPYIGKQTCVCAQKDKTNFNIQHSKKNTKTWKLRKKVRKK